MDDVLADGNYRGWSYVICATRSGAQAEWTVYIEGIADPAGDPRQDMADVGGSFASSDEAIATAHSFMHSFIDAAQGQD
ncbi:hypothetical protein A6B37_00095 [Achromobacter sp. HZ01]|jgi:hypothetical protein|uniref:Uncharacterized protein n=1 Tax=Achromobacter pulmonis TaxID=1389932 RepID=A0A2N8KM15_9BURK|nr:MULTISPECIES: hypothetical protein [Achromobacter]MBO9332660.1 hypothetical protein [Achromobacter xylosoxidans]PND34496.1 hypothetical protein C1I89_09885 [Achromobacter pulmonis]RAP64417.1 hypothetical protein A6B37_00095 [Achromobacter sp. HZ01]